MRRTNKFEGKKGKAFPFFPQILQVFVFLPSVVVGQPQGELPHPGGNASSARPSKPCSDPWQRRRDGSSVRRRWQCDSGISPGSLAQRGVSSDSRFEEGSRACVRLGGA